uniref:Large ribosomal subunit protein uL18c n=1 Tax=Gelidium kathyanniae TaxID=2483893 RepID=A0A3G2QYJ9_9FLOR|nr:ribosomal protein L18 [Gelidium kathyanniae]AYO28018.1 ribosomal protein L18 [Gelidium kathyanniae]
MKKKIKGTPQRPRLYVFKSNKHIYAQIIDDINCRILFSSSSICKEFKTKIKSGANCETANIIGQNIAVKSKKQGINQIIFDRGKKLYHGRIKAVADAARKEGLIF